MSDALYPNHHKITKNVREGNVDLEINTIPQKFLLIAIIYFITALVLHFFLYFTHFYHGISGFFIYEILNYNYNYFRFQASFLFFLVHLFSIFTFTIMLACVFLHYLNAIIVLMNLKKLFYPSLIKYLTSIISLGGFNLILFVIFQDFVYGFDIFVIIVLVILLLFLSPNFVLNYLVLKNNQIKSFLLNRTNLYPQNNYEKYNNILSSLQNLESRIEIIEEELQLIKKSI
jgi:hypothetical protein